MTLALRLARLCEGRKRMKLRQSLNWLLEQYLNAVEEIEQDRREDSGTTISTAYKTAKIGVYSKVIQDLTEILEEGEDE